jgi:uncharacterized protein YjbI with pentapeptide repeats
MKKNRFPSWLPITVVAAVVVALFVSFRSILWPAGGGFGEDKLVVTNVEKNAQGNVIRFTETTTIQPGRALWDWLSLLGVPLSLAVLGAWLQQLEQRRSEKTTHDQQQIADNEAKEEALQVYIDRISTLLVDKNLLAIAGRRENSDFEEQDRELLDAATDVIRARTLSSLRRFENDVKRKNSVVRFLVEAEVINKLKLDLIDADLSDANLSDANLSGVNLSGANLSKANLSNANLSGANLSKADFIGATLIHANLSNANLSNANLSDATLINANLSNADLRGVNLIGATLINVNLSDATLINVNLKEANLRGATLIGTDIRGANLSNANLSNANLSHANLIGADLSGVNLSHADLSNANLSHANLSDANLSHANLSHAYLSDAHLSRAKNLTDEQLTPAKLCNTELSEGSKLDPNRDCQEFGIDLESSK